MKITTLIENRAITTDPVLVSEWGLSLHIAFNDYSILFDTGASGLFADNAKKPSINPSVVKIF
jgi:7,8-dihydropterin-6-yl-methyl-4-(beta-D-ribofuranosyl)aminobenzene 5'-phosphate synthase